MKINLTPRDTQRVAFSAGVKADDVRRYLRGEQVPTTVGARIVTTLHQLGLARLVVDLPTPALPSTSRARKRRSHEEEE